MHYLLIFFSGFSGIMLHFGYCAQVRDAGNLLTRAGFTLPSVDVDQYTVKYKSCKHYISQFFACKYFLLFSVHDLY